jgi:uncharacterized OB-fold protein
MDAVLHDFYARLETGIVAGHRCRSCGTVSFPPRGLCGRCGSGEAEWLPLQGTGTLLFASAGPNLLLGKPYLMATVALTEGPVISGPLLDAFDFKKPETVWRYTGAALPVRLEIGRHEGGAPFVGFRTASG